MNLRSIIITALLIALSFIGANVKIVGSAAFDSMPGFLGALILGTTQGAVIGAAGHFLTASLAGFPLSLPVHLITMVIMALTMAAFGAIYRRIAKGQLFSLRGALVSGVAAVLINGPIGVLVLAPLLLPLIGKGGIAALLPIISGVAAFNILVAFLIYRLSGPVVAEGVKVKKI